ncbi:MAG TPA: slipin family protein [Planctomycetota bacterium]|nr:slipin family protein [Planctomycetota bacterium]
MRKFKIGAHERGMLFQDGEFKCILEPGRHWFFDPLYKITVETVSVRDVLFRHKDLDVIVKSGALKGAAEVLDLKDEQRALVWVDGRFEAVLKPGLHALWTVFHTVTILTVNASNVLFDHADMQAILRGKGAAEALDVYVVEQGQSGLFFRDGKFISTLKPGTHVFWKGVDRVRVQVVDARELAFDIAGQELMTADKVTLRLNAVVTYRIADALKAVATVDDYKQALYREAQLALRAVIGSRELDALLVEKDAVAKELEGLVKNRAAALGLEVTALGIRDVILPGEMKDLLNKVTEARKAAEAALITRREETAAMRMQANTAKILETSPVLMRLRELEVLEKISGKSNLKIVLGERGLVDRVSKML